MFMEVKLHWTTVDFKRKLRIRESPALFTEPRYCLPTYGTVSTTTQYHSTFDCAPPSLEEYLNHKSAPVEDSDDAGPEA